MFYGIYAVDYSNLTVVNSNFLHMENSSEPYDGTGIYADLSTLTLTQAPGTGRCSFENNPQGVWIRRAPGPCTVEHADFDVPFYGSGIRYEFPGINRLRLEYNDFELLRTSRTAIYVERPPANASILNSRINDNHILVTAGEAQTTCFIGPHLQVRGWKDASNIMEISANYIENFSDCRRAHGIYLYGLGDNYQLSGNLLEYFGDPESIGVGSLNNERDILGIVFTDMPGIGNLMVGNGVRSYLHEDPNELNEDNEYNHHSFIKCAIHVVNCNEPLICDNNTHDTYRGFHFGDANPDMIFGLNDMHTHVFGLDCRKSGDGSPNTDIADQVRRENTWSTDEEDYIDGGVGARYFDAMNVPFKFYYDPDYVLSGHRPPSATPSIGDWFFLQDGDPLACDAAVPTRGITDFDIKVAKGEYPYPNAAAQWDLQRRLWYKLTRFPELVDDDPDVEDFYDSTIGHSAQLFAAALYEYGQAFLASGELAEDLNDLFEEHDALQEAIRDLDAEINEDTTSLDGGLAEDLGEKILALAELNGDLTDLIEDYTVERDAALEDMETTVGNLPGYEPYEIAWITILSLAVKQGLGEELSAGEREDLIAIAESCPADVGSAWQEVLAFMPAEDAAPYLGRESDEDCAEERFSTATGLPTPAALSLSPNPTSRWLTITMPEQVGGIWTISAMTGQVLRRGETTAGPSSARLDVAAFVPGTYLLQFISAQGSQYVSKFSVVK